MCLWRPFLMMKMIYVARFYIMCVLYIYLCVVCYDDGNHLFMCVCMSVCIDVYNTSCMCLSSQYT